MNGEISEGVVAADKIPGIIRPRESDALLGWHLIVIFPLGFHSARTFGYVPGVILTEAAALTAGSAIGEPGRSYLLSAIRQMKFMRPVGPDTTVEFTATKTGEVGGLLQFHVSARVDGETVAEGVLILNKVLGPAARPS
jgi:hypothetical protein